MNLSKLRQQQFYYLMHFIIKIIILCCPTNQQTEFAKKEHITSAIMCLVYAVWWFVSWMNKILVSFVRIICVVVVKIEMQRTQKKQAKKILWGQCLYSKICTAFCILFTYFFSVPLSRWMRTNEKKNCNPWKMNIEFVYTLHVLISPKLCWWQTMCIVFVVLSMVFSVKFQLEWWYTKRRKRTK